MAKVLGDDEIPDDAGVAIEYQRPQSSKRIDFVITGEDEFACTKSSSSSSSIGRSSAAARRTLSCGHAPAGARVNARARTLPYQAWPYASYLQDFNAAVQNGAMTEALRLPAQPGAGEAHGADHD